MSDDREHSERELCQKFQTLARVQTDEQREVSDSFRLTVLRHSALDVDAHSSRDARRTLRCKGAKPGQLVTHLAREIIQSKVVEKVEKKATTSCFHPTLTTLRTQCPTLPSFVGGLQS